MAALDFPANPTVGQQYAAPNGVTYQWDGAVWVVTGGPPGQLWTGAGSTLTPTDPSKTVAIPNVNALQWGTRTIKNRLQANATVNAATMNVNVGPSAPDDTTKPGWSMVLQVDSDDLEIWRYPTGANPTAVVMTRVDNAGNVIAGGTLKTGGTLGSVLITGNAAGIKCQNVGTMTGDGYSNNVAFGWDGTLKARIDSTIIGTVTVTSDARVKRDVAEDVPGLAAVEALRPVSFEYDQTKREIGFPDGRHYGLIAQEAAPSVPLVIETEGEFLSIDYRALVPVLIRAVQELSARVKAPAPNA